MSLGNKGIVWGIIWSGAFALQGCNFLSLDNRSDATSVIDANHGVALPKQSNLTRFSGRALSVRFAKLFPEQSSSFNQSTFSLEFATGADQAIAQVQRPVNALQQIAVKNYVTKFCANAPVPASYSSAEAGSIYSDKVFFSDETPPTDEATLAALVVARNAWLEPLPVSAPEIQSLIKLYTEMMKVTTVQEAGNQRASAHRALCQAALLSAQFSLGIPGPRDSLRRMMIEVGSRIPTFAELEAVTKGRKTVVQFLTEMQADRNSGYYNAIHQWHQDWLGLRSFLPNSWWADTYPNDTSTFDPRGGFPGASRNNTAFSFGGAFQYSVRNEQGLSSPLAFLVSNYEAAPITCDATPEAFDPRTTMILFETEQNGKWQVQGAFVAQARINDYRNRLSEYGVSDFDPSVDCSLFSAPMAPDARFASNDGGPEYYRCRGRVNGSATQMTGLPLPHDGLPADFPTRVRRFSPSGEQHGVSAVKTWYTNETRYVCNNFTRYLLTCPMRPTSGVGSVGSPGDYTNYSEPGMGQISLGTYWSAMPLAHPGILNFFRCGKPDPQVLNRTPYDEVASYPYGYSRSAYFEGGLGTLNDIMTLGQSSSETGNEALALKRLRNDIKMEPYRLIDYVVSSNRSYKEVFTANYVVGHDELDLFYRAQGQHLPTYPPGYIAKPGLNRDPAADPAPYRLADHQNIPSSYFTNTVGIYSGNPFYAIFQEKGPGSVPPRPAAGVLAMPAFVSPVGVKMRTIASRYFSRLLCGEPSVYQPSGAEKTLHKKYMLDVNNPATSRTAADHLNEKSSCYYCHVNLDPLGAALSHTYLANVQRDEYRAATGEMSYQGVWQGGSWLGSVYHPTKGTGAFLGAEVTGLEGVAHRLVESDLWSSCVVEKTFENVFGRVKAAADEEAMKQFHAKFKKDYNYNNLVRTMVSSDLYQGAN